jgi:hypothetical protein
MILIVYLLCLVPLALGFFFSRIRPAFLYFILAFAIVVALAPTNSALNAKFDPSGGYRQGHFVVIADPHFIEQVTGTFAWRFFDWGIIKGNGHVSDFMWWLHDTFNLRLATVAHFDVTNPTPCMLFVILLIFAGVSFIAIRKPQPQRDLPPGNEAPTAS